MTAHHRASENDELYTPNILVKAITPYIKRKIVWCPFDTKNSEFVKELSKDNVVISTHIKGGYDFFEYEPDNYDVIVSNPPFSKKLEVLDRVYKLGKPFALLLPMPMLNYQVIGSFFLDKELQLLIVDKKVSFNGNTSAFNSSYFCNGLLPKDLMFAHLEHNNSNKHYIPSSMYEDF